MLTVEFQGETGSPGMLPWLRVADACHKIRLASDTERRRASEMSWVEWRQPSSYLPDREPDGIPSSEDWLWLRDRPRLLGIDRIPADSAAGLARMLAPSRGITRAGLDALALAAAAREARLDPVSWSLALLEWDPRRWSHDVQATPGVEPALGWWSVWATPDWMPGLSGPGLALALADLARTDRYRCDHATGPDGRDHPVPPDVWDRIDGLGLAGSFGIVEGF